MSLCLCIINVYDILISHVLCVTEADVLANAYRCQPSQA